MHSNGVPSSSRQIDRQADRQTDDPQEMVCGRARKRGAADIINEGSDDVMVPEEERGERERE